MTFAAEGSATTANFEWSGSLTAGETSLIDFQLPYNVPGELEIDLVALNGEARSNEQTSTIEPAVPAANTIEVTITPDCWANEVSWEIRDAGERGCFSFNER